MTKADTHLQEHLQFAKADKQTKNCKRACKFSPVLERACSSFNSSKELVLAKINIYIKTSCKLALARHLN